MQTETSTKYGEQFNLGIKLKNFRRNFHHNCKK